MEYIVVRCTIENSKRLISGIIVHTCSISLLFVRTCLLASYMKLFVDTERIMLLCQISMYGECDRVSCVSVWRLEREITAAAAAVDMDMVDRLTTSSMSPWYTGTTPSTAMATDMATDTDTDEVDTVDTAVDSMVDMAVDLDMAATEAATVATVSTEANRRRG